ncbi:12943_t:CDS:1 [Acaulospora colombiana]|uniref:12943_t:CDS:1 n=1 Tax=Acaulospora colombiana TaxID=27376 RepID=A0ACA9KI16_9GLOM|nr:12943_t:CDS:1 [Acaulospora colombiana]
MEVWLPIAKSSSLISNFGRIKKKKGIILRQNACKRDGYVKTNININGIRTTIRVHILVTRAFIPNSENRPYVNHINGIKHDNRVDNLEWVTSKENAERKVFLNTGHGSSRRIVQKTLDGKVVQIWDSIRLAGNSLEITRTSISECCSRKRSTAGGWCWMYYEDYIEPDLDEEWKEIELDSRKFNVSSLGRVQLPNGVITQGSLYAGYYRIGRVHKYRVHRFVALAFCSKEEGKEYVNHIDGDSTNNNATHLISNGVHRKKIVNMPYASGFKSINMQSNRFSLMVLSKNFHPWPRLNVQLRLIVEILGQYVMDFEFTLVGIVGNT